jgi:site-specific recombinase XerD
MVRADAPILRDHTGQTAHGNVRDVKVDRIGKVTIYKRGQSFWLYYRENRQTQRQRVDGNLAVARATAAKVSAALDEQRPSPLGFARTQPAECIRGYLDYVENVQGLAWRTVDRYRAALDRYQEFCTAAEVATIDAVDDRTVEDFVRWLRGQTRARNGMPQGKKGHYKVGGIKFILSTCRTLYNWAARRRQLPPYAENPFHAFPIDRLRDPTEADEGVVVLTPAQEEDFLRACSEWHQAIFVPLISYGMRVGELVHLLIENVDFTAGTVEICSKPEMFWRVKTARRRRLPLTAATRALLRGLIGTRKAGFVLLNDRFHSGEEKPVDRFGSDRDLRRHLEQMVADLEKANPEATKGEKRRAVMAYCRALGQLPERRILAEFQKLTAQIGCPQFTRVHDLRHLFTTRAQELGANPLVVQQIVGHASLNMTKRYTHLGTEIARGVVERAGARTPATVSTEGNPRS